jgi:YidC/Oxa1 family membrane protein insertase
MDIKKLVLVMIFFTSALFLWEEWKKEQLPQSPSNNMGGQEGGQHAAAPANFATQGAKSEANAQLQGGGTPVPGEKLISAQPTKGSSSEGGAVSTVVSNKLESGEKILVKTDMVVAEIDTAGGDLRHLELLHHPSREDKSKPFALLQNEFARVNVAQSGLIGEGLPSHKTRYTADSKSYNLVVGEDTVEIRLSAPEVAGIKATKIYTFHRGSYLIDVRFEINNQGSSVIQPFSYFQVLRASAPVEASMFMVPQYTGATVYTEEEKFLKVKFSDIDDGTATYPKNADNGWIAMQEHYFLTAWLPKDKTLREYYAKRLGENQYTAGVIVPVGAIQPGETASVDVPFYVGPQEQSKLAELAPGLDLVVDYGWLTIIGAPLFWLLSMFHSWTGNWGVSIILLTMLVKLFFFPLSAAGYRSMAKLKAVTPKLQRLREQHGKDKQRMNQAMMEFYKAEKINPMGGCLPILVQIPVFISLYWVLLASVELRYAPFALWIQDLSSPDPYYVLPVMMGVSMFIQTKLNPAATDPIQQKVMQIMPLVFSVFFFFFPAGLVLYSLVNNSLSIAQQWQITRMYAPSTTVPAIKKK